MVLQNNRPDYARVAPLPRHLSNMNTPRSATLASPKPRPKPKPKPRAVKTPPATPRKPEKRKPPPSSPSTPSARPRKRAREQKRANPSVNASLLSLTAKYVNPQSRVFGKEFQSLIHAFGDIRYCARETLELVEDSIRQEVRRIAPGGLRAVCSRLNAKALSRLNRYFKSCDIGIRIPVRHYYQPLVSLADSLLETSLPPEFVHAVDWQAHCMWRLLQAFRLFMPDRELTELIKCKEVSFTKGESRSEDPKIYGIARVVLFKDWIGVPVTNEHLFALSHLAWELVGQLIQVALLQRHHAEQKRDNENPSSRHWSQERHMMEALGHGISTAIAVPCTDLQAKDLWGEIELLIGRLLAEKSLMRAKSNGLLPTHIYAALDYLKDHGWGGQCRMRAGLFDIM